MSRVTHSNGSCRTHKWVVSHSRMSSVAQEHTQVADVYSICKSHVTKLIQSCHVFEYVMSCAFVARIRMCRTILTNESCHKGAHATR